MPLRAAKLPRVRYVCQGMRNREQRLAVGDAFMSKFGRTGQVVSISFDEATESGPRLLVVLNSSRAVPAVPSQFHGFRVETEFGPGAEFALNLEAVTAAS